MDRRTLIDERIKNLLTNTNLTFKQIIEKLRSENMSASFNTIRRVNRNHRYRKPRYDAKLTPQQRKELIVELKNTSKPNLSLLARQYGVCHGSIWYWWDKLSKIREKNNGLNDEPSLELDDDMEQDFMSGGIIDNDDELADYDDDDTDPLDLDEEDSYDKGEEEFFAEDVGEVELVGPVQAKNNEGVYIKLPIVMYAPILSSKNWLIDKSISDTSSSTANSTPTNSSDRSSSISERLRVI